MQLTADAGHCNFAARGLLRPRSCGRILRPAEEAQDFPIVKVPSRAGTPLRDAKRGRCMLVASIAVAVKRTRAGESRKHSTVASAYQLLGGRPPAQRIQHNEQGVIPPPRRRPRGHEELKTKKNYQRGPHKQQRAPYRPRLLATR